MSTSWNLQSGPTTSTLRTYLFGLVNTWRHRRWVPSTARPLVSVPRLSGRGRETACNANSGAAPQCLAGGMVGCDWGREDRFLFFSFLFLLFFLF